MKMHWEYIKNTKNLKNRTELKKFLRCNKRSPLKFAEKVKNKKVKLPTKKSENGLEISESE